MSCLGKRAPESPPSEEVQTRRVLPQAAGHQGSTRDLKYLEPWSHHSIFQLKQKHKTKKQNLHTEFPLDTAPRGVSETLAPT